MVLWQYGRFDEDAVPWRRLERVEDKRLPVERIDEQGFSWPESYHVTYLPGFDKFVVTASRDGPDAWGCSDHAIGVADGDLSPVEAAKKVIVEFWGSQVSAWEQCRWAYLFGEGLIDSQTANAWADEVWCVSEEETEELEP